MKKAATTTGGGGGSRNQKPKILGATQSPQISEDDASRLVGGIVEKGFADIPQTRPLGPAAGPRPTVLPFPVARHRSHGPHWAPRVGNVNAVNGNDDMDEDDAGEEEEFDGMEMAASVADPIQRKEKKGLDFSQWQEIAKSDRIYIPSEKKKKELDSIGLKAGNKVKETKPDKLSRHIADPDNVKLRASKHGTEGISQARERSHNDIVMAEESAIMEEVPEWQNGSAKEIQVDLKTKSMQKSDAVSGFDAKKMVGGEETNLQSQIDAENRSRLAKMSADEIAEAQAELMAKLNPELINALKKRGQSNVKRQKFSLSDGTNGEADSTREENPSKLTSSTGKATSDKPVKVETLQYKDDEVSQRKSPESGSMWDAWRKRVELVRDMRFSLDGNIITSDFAHVSDTGKASSESGYSADNVSERDFLRTEGDPSAAGYTIKEAVTLTRSVVPGQRALALHLLAAVLNRAICSICQNQGDSVSKVDWEAIWAFALGPEPELALALRISLDDNHNSVVLACAKVIQCALSCDMNDIIFDIFEKTPTYARDICTAPVFRSKPDVNSGFLRGVFWKYNTKPSNILRSGEELVDEKAEDEHTIQDDVVVAGQDLAAGLVRMGILTRICFLLETDPAAPLEECLISILIAIARHSPTCATAIVDCRMLLQTIANRFATKEQMKINYSKIKSVILLKVLARVQKRNCLTFINNGIFKQMTWHLYRYPFSLDQWAKLGREACKLSSALMVEQLRLWKVFVHYGYCISEFPSLFTSLSTWLSVPTIEKLIEDDVMTEYCAITKEAYLLLDVLAGRLPNYYSIMPEEMEDADQDNESWSWRHFGPIIELSLEWIRVKSIPRVSRLFNCQNDENRNLQDSEVNSFLWVLSSVLSMLSSVLRAVIPEDITSLPNGHFPWLPDFVPKVGLEIIKNGYMWFSGVSDAICNNQLPEDGSIVKYLCHLRLKSGRELAISSTCCLQGLIQVVHSVDKLIQHANLEIHNAPSKFESLPREDKVIAGGILKSCVVEVRYLLTTLMKSITNEWQHMQSVEMFSRGGPAPGVGVGWGASGGGYWSLNTLLAQQDARLLTKLLQISEIPFNDSLEAGKMDFAMQTLNCVLTACLIVGPANSYVIDKLLEFIFRVPVLKYLDFGIRHFLSLSKGYNPFKWNYEEEEFVLMANVLVNHFRNRWLGVKKNRKAKGDVNGVSQKPAKKGSGRSLETIHEDMNVPKMPDDVSSSLRVEWVQQRLPLPAHWFLSSISTVNFEKNDASRKENFTKVPSYFLEIAKNGLFFLLGIEAISTPLSSEFISPVKCVPVVWKLHAMSVTLVSGMGVLEDEKSRDVYQTLQNVYGEILDEKQLPLRFESDIHENYSTFVETLVEQFAAESYGDVLFGQQVAMYLNRYVEAPVRLATWNALSNARALELLPPLDKCFTKTEGYLEPVEDDERILEAYVKSWGSGALDKAATRNSVTFSIVIHHLSSFIFGNIAADKLSLRNKLAKSLLRYFFSRKHQHEGMMVKLICYKKATRIVQPTSETDSSLPLSEIGGRLQLLKEICDGNVSAVEKLESCIRREFNGRTPV